MEGKQCKGQQGVAERPPGPEDAAGEGVELKKKKTTLCGVKIPKARQRNVRRPFVQE